MKHSLKLVLSLIGTVLCFGTAFASLTSDVSYSITIEKSDPRLAKVKVVFVPQDALLPNPAPDNKFSKAIVIINSADATDGEVIGNNISMLVEKGGDKTSRLFSRFIFAHEFFHLWNGKSFSPTNDETKWFKEGFTNYYTLKSLHNVGFLTDESYLEVLNSLFYQRYKKDDGVGKIAMTKGEEKHDHWGLIYGGGMFVGIAQDMIIRETTNNRKSLDDLMKDLFKKYGGTSKGYSLDELRARMSELSGKSQARFYSELIVGTKELPITDYLQNGRDQSHDQGQKPDAFKKVDATARHLS